MRVLGIGYCNRCNDIGRVWHEVHRSSPSSIQIMARPIIVSTNVVDKLSDVVAYLKDDLKLSQEAALKYRDRFLDFIHLFKEVTFMPIQKWCERGYRCAVFEKQWVIAYEIVDKGIIVQDISNTALLKE